MKIGMLDLVELTEQVTGGSVEIDPAPPHDVGPVCDGEGLAGVLFHEEHADDYWGVAAPSAGAESTGRQWRRMSPGSNAATSPLR